MSPARWPVFPKSDLDTPGNETKHNLPDRNRGGSPRDVSKHVPLAQRGGFQQQGRDKVYNRASMGGGRSGSGNPASRGGSNIGSFTPDARIPKHGGSPQKGDLQVSRQFGKPGQAGVPGGNPTQPPPGAGNVHGRSYRLIAGRFQRAAMGAKPTKNSGKYGSPPVTSNT